MNLRLNELCYKGETLPGELFNDIVIVSAWGENNYYRILYDSTGELLMDKNLVDRISRFYGLSFSPGFLDGKQCFINSENIK